MLAFVCASIKARIPYLSRCTRVLKCVWWSVSHQALLIAWHFVVRLRTNLSVREMCSLFISQLIKRTYTHYNLLLTVHVGQQSLCYTLTYTSVPREEKITTWNLTATNFLVNEAISKALFVIRVVLTPEYILYKHIIICNYTVFKYI